MLRATATSVPAITRDRLAFLHGDLCLSTEVVARTFGVTEGDIADARKDLNVKGCHLFFGEITRTTFQELAKIIRVDPNELNSVETRGQWHRMRGVLGSAFVRLASEGTIPWSDLDRFLEQLPGVQADAKARVTASRLKFLYGDLGANHSEIMAILDTTESAVRRGLIHHGIERHQQHYPELDERALDELARRLSTEWTKYWHDRSKTYGFWPTVKREVRDGLMALAHEHRLDLAVLDRFLAEVPAIATAEREKWRARMGLSSEHRVTSASHKTRLTSETRENARPARAPHRTSAVA